MRAPTAITEPKPHRGDPPFCPPHADPAHAELPPSAHPPLPTPLSALPGRLPLFATSVSRSRRPTAGSLRAARAVRGLSCTAAARQVSQLSPQVSQLSPQVSQLSPKSHNSPPSLTTLPPTHTHVTHSTTYARISGTLPCSLSSQFDAGMHGAMRRGLPQRRLRPVQRALGLPGRL